MAQLIRNNSELLCHGQRRVREDALKIIESGFRASDPGMGTHRHVKVAGKMLYVGGIEFDLDHINHVYVVGAGKGAYPIAEALEDILGPYITEGVVVAKRGEKRRLKHIEVCEAGHPIPDEDSVTGAEKILAIANKASDEDLVFAAITGGSSALVTLPPDGIRLEEIEELTNLLLRCGAVIREINIVRKHLCRMKGGKLVADVQPAQAITLTLDTQPEGMPWPDMSLPDPSTFQDAIDVLKYYDLWKQVSPSIREYLIYAKKRPELETVKSLAGMRTVIISVGDPVTTCEAASTTARELGYRSVILSTNMEGEAGDVGKCMAGIAKEIVQYDRPFKRPCALISGGELTVTLAENFGEGGPNQEFVLGFATMWKGENEIACAAVDTDGTDGPTDIAGGIIDGHILKEAKEKKVDLAKFLRKHKSLEALQRLHNAIITGHTGTNVLDLRVILIR
jgi:glycerate 2-kinase